MMFRKILMGLKFRLGERWLMLYKTKYHILTIFGKEGLLYSHREFVYY